MHCDPPCSTAIASYVQCSSYANTRHGNYIMHNEYGACTRVSKDKKTLAYLPVGAYKIAFEYMYV